MKKLLENLCGKKTIRREKEMAHNPNTIKSFDDINEGGRKSDVLVEAISKLETTTKELEKVKKQLDVAKKSILSALQFLACMDRISEEKCNEQLAFDELNKALEEL